MGYRPGNEQHYPERAPSNRTIPSLARKRGEEPSPNKSTEYRLRHGPKHIAPSYKPTSSPPRYYYDLHSTIKPKAKDLQRKPILTPKLTYNELVI